LTLSEKLRIAAEGHASVRELLFDAADELEEYELVFDRRWDADMRAIKRWQKATGRKLTWPDHADMVVWLLGQLESAKA
jgi:hypothetical protein